MCLNRDRRWIPAAVLMLVTLGTARAAAEAPVFVIFNVDDAGLSEHILQAEA